MEVEEEKEREVEEGEMKGGEVGEPASGDNGEVEYQRQGVGEEEGGRKHAV